MSKRKLSRQQRWRIEKIQAERAERAAKRDARDSDKLAAGEYGPERPGRVIALDILEMPPLAGVEFLHGDFREDAVLSQLETALGGRPVDLVLSDMAPNKSGMDSVDQPRAMHLAELAMDFADHHLRPGGAFLIKLFQGVGFDDYVRDLRRRYDRVAVRKPSASRQRSPEVYALARGKRTHMK